MKSLGRPMKTLNNKNSSLLTDVKESRSFKFVCKWMTKSIARQKNQKRTKRVTMRGELRGSIYARDASGSVSY